MNMQNFKHNKTSGFSLIELMVVIAIVALLAAVAVPAYKSYLGKSRMAEVRGFIQDAKSSWAQKKNLGQTPTDITANLGDYIDAIDFTSTGFAVTMVDSDAIGAEFDDAAKVITYTGNPDDANGNVTWSCVITGGLLAYRNVIQNFYFTDCDEPV